MTREQGGLGIGLAIVRELTATTRRVGDGAERGT